MFKRIIIIIVFIILGYTCSMEIVDFNKAAHSFVSESAIIQNIFRNNAFFQTHFGSDGEYENSQTAESISIEMTESVKETDWSEYLSYEGDGYYYGLLELQEQALYGVILDAYLSYNESVDLSERYYDMSSEAVHKVHWYVLLDHPEIYWVSETNSIAYYDVDDEKKLETLNITNNYSIDQIVMYEYTLETVVSAVYEYVSSAESDYEKAVLVYEYLILNCEYDEESAAVKLSESEEAYSDDIIESGTIIGCLINKKAVCSGYAKAYDYLLEALGIECFSVVGYAEEVGHEWNMISLDGAYYNVDCTWGDPVLEEADKDYISYGYFGLTSELISTTHTVTEDMEYPECTMLDYNYYYHNGWWYETYAYESISAQFTEAIENQEETISFCFTTAEEYETALQMLVDEDLSEIIGENQSVLDSKCSYTSIEALNQITIKVVYK